MPTLKEEAETQRLSVLVGLSTVADVESWALHLVETEATLDPAILALFHSPNERPEDIAGKLSFVAGPDCTAVVVKRLYSELSHRLEEKPEQARLILDMLNTLVYIGATDELDSSEIDRLNDVFQLASTGIYGTTPDAARELAAFLHRDGHPPMPVLARSN